jgi:hypothetical protein
MIQKIKKFTLLIATLFTVGVPALVPSMALAASCDNVQTGVVSGVHSATGDNVHGGACGESPDAGTTQLRTIFATIVNVFSIIVGAAAVIMIIYGGFRYITSGGDSGRVGNAKNTLIYAIVGLIIVALAQFLVRYVFNTATNVGV